MLLVSGDVNQFAQIMGSDIELFLIKFESFIKAQKNVSGNSSYI